MSNSTPALPADEYDIAVVVPTFNRGELLTALLENLMVQDPGETRCEILVVDNNSTDNTRAVVEPFVGRWPGRSLRYVFEPRQGVSFARNTGVSQSTAPIIVFLDDDGLPVPDWIQAMKAAFDAHPDVDCIGGRIRAAWVHQPPSWMTPPHWGPIALQDRPAAAWFDRDHAAACLLSANLGCRRAAFEEVGGFSPEYPRNQDREFELRLWRAGKRGLYLPAMDVVVEVPAHRLTKQYHRRWQATTGKYHALMRYRDCLSRDGALFDEPIDGPRLFGSPLFLYREFLQHVKGWIAGLLMFDRDRRFFHETRLWYYVSFFRTRWATVVAGRDSARQLSRT
jgi:glycosyltransferase involved in cell wall biosynthesis